MKPIFIIATACLLLAGCSHTPSVKQRAIALAQQMGYDTTGVGLHNHHRMILDTINLPDTYAFALHFSKRPKNVYYKIKIQGADTQILACDSVIWNIIPVK